MSGLESINGQRFLEEVPKALNQIAKNQAVLIEKMEQSIDAQIKRDMAFLEKVEKGIQETQTLLNSIDESLNKK